MKQILVTQYILKVTQVSKYAATLSFQYSSTSAFYYQTRRNLRLLLFNSAFPSSFFIVYYLTMYKISHLVALLERSKERKGSFAQVPYHIPLLFRKRFLSR